MNKKQVFKISVSKPHKVFSKYRLTMEPIYFLKIVKIINSYHNYGKPIREGSDEDFEEKVNSYGICEHCIEYMYDKSKKIVQIVYVRK